MSDDQPDRCDCGAEWVQRALKFVLTAETEAARVVEVRRCKDGHERIEGQREVN